jgi:glutamate-ammonia-ligase adenylyltransferase
VTSPLDPRLEEAVRSSADPAAVALVFSRLGAERLEEPGMAEKVAAVAGASRSLGRLLGTDEAALEILGSLSSSAAEMLSFTAVEEASDEKALVRQKELAYLAIAACDLLGWLSLEEVGALLSRLADTVLERAWRLCDSPPLAVIAMGKLGAEELNYASDIDVVFVAAEQADPEEAAQAARALLQLAGRCYRVDSDLRPEGRNGALVRSLASYEAYWEAWAAPWEFQALLKTRASAGPAELGESFVSRAQEAVWGRSLDAGSLDELRRMKARTEEAVARRGLSDRELKRGPGGIRDIEFACQLLQLVHGRSDPALRVRPTLGALAELAAAGYVDRKDASVLALSYRFLRTVEHRLQLVEGSQVHTVPAPGPARDHLARVLGLTDAASRARRGDRFERVLARYQSSVRSIHERLFFRPLLEVFAGGGPVSGLSPGAAEERLSAFGFRQADRTRQALSELTRGLTRSSRLMQQLLPVLLGWLSETPDPDLGLLGLRNLAGQPHQRDVVVAAFRDSPELARRLCLLLGTGRRLGELALKNPALLLRLGDDDELLAVEKKELLERALATTGEAVVQTKGLQRLVAAEVLRIAAADLIGLLSPQQVARSLSHLGDAALAAALSAAKPALPFSIVAMGRLGGDELAYGSDLDVVFVYEGRGDKDAKEAARVADVVVSVLNGKTPAERIWTVDVSLRPEGRQGPLARSLEAYVQYHERWISPWERQALLRARPAAGDPGLLESFFSLAKATLTTRPFGEEERREIRRLKARAEKERIPAGEDPQFHLKLGRGSLSDIEWTVQLLELEAGVVEPHTAEALSELSAAGVLSKREAESLAQALLFLTATRNRWHLVGNYISAGGGLVNPAGSDSLPQSNEALGRLARSLSTSPTELRQEYRRLTRRARRVVERRFYGL